MAVKAAHAYDAWARALYGDAAVTNFDFKTGSRNLHAKATRGAKKSSKGGGSSGGAMTAKRAASSSQDEGGQKRMRGQQPLKAPVGASGGAMEGATNGESVAAGEASAAGGGEHLSSQQ